MKVVFLLLFLLSMIQFFVSCDSGDGKLILINRSKDLIRYRFIWDNDSNLCNGRNLMAGIKNHTYGEVISPNDSIHSVVENTSWEEFIESRFKDHSLKIAFMSNNRNGKLTKDSISILYPKIFIHSYTVDSLKKMNWRVAYY